LTNLLSAIILSAKYGNVRGAIMRFVRFRREGEEGLAVQVGAELRGLLASDPDFPGTLDALIRKGPDAFKAAAAGLSKGASFPADTVSYLPPFASASKLICVGLNYADHSAESGFETPDYPTLFSRFNSSLIGH
jgi:acylpyruvate hydrolase